MELIITENSIQNDLGLLNYEIDNNCIIVNSLDAFEKRCGIGSSLVKRLEELSNEKNISLIEVTASPTYEAISFWFAMNYKPATKEDKIYCNKLFKSNNERIETNSGVIVFNKKFK